MTHYCCSCWQIDLDEILSFIPCEWCREKPRPLGVPPEASKCGVICVQNNLICPGSFDPHPIVGEALSRVEVEDPQQSGSFEDDHFILLVLQADIRLWRVQPAVFLLRPLHLSVEFVEELVPQQPVIGQVELTTSVQIAVVIAVAWEVEPFRMTEFVPFEIKITFTAKAMCDETNHLVQAKPSLDHGREFCEYRHVGVHFLVAQPHKQ